MFVIELESVWSIHEKWKPHIDWFISEKGMYVGLKQPRGDGERYVTPARAAAEETSAVADIR